MDEMVHFKFRQRSSWSVNRLSLAGQGLPERMRSTAFALLGITAAAGLGMVAIFSQQGWPLLSPSPLPSAPAGIEAIDDAAIVGPTDAVVEDRSRGPEAGGVAAAGAAPAPADTGAGVAGRLPIDRHAQGGPAEPPNGTSPEPQPTSPEQPSAPPAPSGESAPVSQPVATPPPVETPATPAPTPAAVDPPGNGNGNGNANGHDHANSRGAGSRHLPPGHADEEPPVAEPEPEPEPVEPSPPAQPSYDYGPGHGHAYGNGHWHHG
jgi:hypothetical protein